jgi:hypothetical protein
MAHTSIRLGNFGSDLVGGLPCRSTTTKLSWAQEVDQASVFEQLNFSKRGLALIISLDGIYLQDLRRF